MSLTDNDSTTTFTQDGTFDAHGNVTPKETIRKDVSPQSVMLQEGDGSQYVAEQPAAGDFHPRYRTVRENLRSTEASLYHPYLIAWALLLFPLSVLYSIPAVFSMNALVRRGAWDEAEHVSSQMTMWLSVFIAIPIVLMFVFSIVGASLV